MTELAVSNQLECWKSLDGLFGSLDDDQWATASLCPGWSVRDVATHIAAIEHMLIANPPGTFVDSLPFEAVGAYMAEVGDLPNDEFLARYRATLSERRAELEALSAADLAVETLTPVGPATYGRFMAIRAFDCWVHEQDVRRPLAQSGHESGPAAEMAIDEIEGSLPYIIGKKVSLSDGLSMSISLSGPVERTMHVAVDGRAARRDELDNPTVTLNADSTTFALLACGRIDPQGAIDDGAISWEGDSSWGERAARNLAFTM